MNLNKSVFLLVLPLVFAFQKDRRQTKIFYNGRYEVLNGRVKQIIISGAELMGSPISIGYSDTILYDRHGNETETRFYRRGDFHAIKILQNIPKGKPYTVENPYPGGIGKSVTKYDNKGKIVEQSKYNRNGLFEKQEYAYNAFDQVVEIRTYDSLNALHNKVVFYYNDEGFLIEEDYFTKSNKNYDSKSLFKYSSFDKMHNWTKQIKIEKGSEDTSGLTDTVIRKITYY